MPTQIGHQCGQTVVFKTIEQFLHMRFAANIGRQARAPSRTALICENGEFRIRAIFDPVLQRFPSGPGESGTLQLAML